ncbi:MAG: enolase C-terminal domain-like protein [Pseudomonadota bacterium]
MLTKTLPAGALAPLPIKRVDAICVRLPLAKPVRMAGVHLHHSDNLLVRIESASGVTGWGESTAAPSHGGATLSDMARTIERDVQALLLGQDAIGLSAHTARLALSKGKADSAIAAVDLALYDLVGKHLGLSAHVLLGGLRRSSIAPLWLVGTASTEEDVAEAERSYRQGYRFFKLKLAVKSLGEDIASTRALRQRFGPEVRLCADANEGLSLDGALAYVRAVADCGLEFLEQPTAKGDVEGLRQLCAASAIPIGLDEAVGGTGDLLRLAPTGIGGAALKTLKLGGLSGVLAAGTVCEALGLRINLSGKIAETSIGSAALLQLGGVLPGVDWGVSPSHLYLGEDVVASPLQPVDGAYAVPCLPGLGIVVDEARVARLRIQPGS